MENERRLLLINIRVQKSRETIEDARLAIENDRLRNALNRIYYSIFYIVSALSLKEEFFTTKHKQLMGWFIKNFIATGKLSAKFSDIYKRAYDSRQESDYEDILDFDKEQVESHYQDMFKFVNEIEKIIKEEY